MAETANKVNFGIRGVVVAPLTISEDGTYTYGAWTSLPGAISLEAAMSGGTSNVYADDVIYTSIFSYAGQDITLNLFELGDSFKKDYLGYVEADNGALVETTDFTTKNFALGFILSGDAKAKKVIFQNCRVAPVTESTTTKTDSVTPNQIALPITAMPVEVNDRLIIKSTMTQGTTGYDTFLTANPTLPTITTLS